MPKNFTSTQIPYSETGKFSKIILDYLAQEQPLATFYNGAPGLENIREAIKQRQSFNTNRAVLVNVLEQQYQNVPLSTPVKNNIALLAEPNTYTVCTAHQPNLFTGHLYFIYKIFHTIKLAEHLNKNIAGHSFVPVFYMGSEDADLEELGHIYLEDKKYEWETKQTGAVGRMKIDDGLVKLMDEIGGRLSVLPFGEEILSILKDCYIKGTTIQDATFHFINILFAGYGLVVLIPDNADLKRSMLPVFEDDIFSNTPSEIVEKSAKELEKHYKVQATPREINLFYLQEGIRNRIMKQGNFYLVEDSGIKFTEAELRQALKDHPENFSPNVILRGLYQETILPNLVFIGGGGELAYWLETKSLFDHYRIPYPLLVLRNSLLLISSNMASLVHKLQLDDYSIFKSETQLIDELVKKESTHQLYLTLEKQQIVEVYAEIKKAAQQIDSSLQIHTDALLAKSLKKLESLEHKMLKAEKIRFDAQHRQVKKLKTKLFPHGDLQERVENFMTWYANYGKTFLTMLYENSLVLEQEFTILTENAH